MASGRARSWDSGFSGDDRSVKGGNMLGREHSEDMMSRLMHQDVFTARELAELIDRPVELVTDAVYEGRLKAVVYDGKIIEISRHDALAWLAKDPT
jgi:hypothetical protein